jgi:hypothetical protein
MTCIICQMKALGVIRRRFKLNRLRKWVAESTDLCFIVLDHIGSLIGAWG